MDCRTFRRNLEDYLDGGLDFPGRFGVERHAQQCLGCGKDLADAQKLSRLTRELARAQAPADFEARVHRLLRSRGLQRRPKLWELQHFWWERMPSRSWAWGTVALLLLVGGIFYSANRVPFDHAPSVPSLTAGSLPPEADKPTVASRPTAVRPAAVPPEILPESAAHLYPSPTPNGPFTLESDTPVWSIEPADSEYVEYVVPAAGGQRLVMRLPKTIRMRHGQPSEEYFIRNVSH
jgi:anti-sigma factor RsiW